MLMPQEESRGQWRWFCDSPTKRRMEPCCRVVSHRMKMEETCRCSNACLKSFCVDAMKIHMFMHTHHMYLRCANTCARNQPMYVREHVYQHVELHVLNKCVCDAPTHVRAINRCMCVNMCISMFSCMSSTNGSAMRQHINTECLQVREHDRCVCVSMFSHFCTNQI